ncbi:MAG TPA: NrfD/PsrC family molybdoenzyme membrane anchor subunit [Mycobacteriales bacterium]
MSGTGGRDGGRRRGGRGRGGRERAMVPPAEFTSYYGRPVIKAPVWKVPDVPAYLFLGGLAGASASMGTLADATGRPALRRVGRVAAAAGATASVGALVHDLGRPERFLNMMRVFKPTSPLSVGSWILAPFSGLATVAAASELTGRCPAIGRLAGAASGVMGPAMATYTAVLLADTAVPAWHEAYHELPFTFAGSALASAGGLGMLAAPVADAGPARRMAVLGGTLEIAATERFQHRLGMLAEPYRTGRPGRFMTAAKALTGAGTLGALVAGRSRAASAACGIALTAGAICTRFAVFTGGVASAKDPKYTVVPQRQRLTEREGG